MSSEKSAQLTKIFIKNHMCRDFKQVLNVIQVATAICQKLFEESFIAYFAGGWVRDLLLKRPTDEIDIATSAPPDVIQSLFSKTIPVGIQFGVVIVVMEGINFEVTTFRKDHPYYDGRHPEGVDYSTPEKDALRRDFTINGMFYDPLTDTIHDYVGGQEDLNNQLIRAIGDPKERFTEDRLRMIRAVRFGSLLNFRIHEETERAIQEFASTLFPSVSMERIWQEFNKMNHLDQALVMMHRLGLLQTIFPQLKETPLSEIEKKVAPFAYFPIDTPTIIYLMEVIPNFSSDTCQYLKTPTADMKLVDFFLEAREPKERELVDWAHFYAHPHSDLFLEIEAAKILPPDRAQFMNEHVKRKQRLFHHIDRVQKKSPLVTSTHLKKCGIKPGKKMGELLRKAERIAINENHTDAENVLKRLGHEISDL